MREMPSHLTSSAKNKIGSHLKTANRRFRLTWLWKGTSAKQLCRFTWMIQSAERYRKEGGKGTENELQNTIDIVKRNKTDVLQFGDVVYRTHPEVWKRWRVNGAIGIS
ncbi:Ger(x)C family spore germination C-terminal domain-containing protein [Bacillus licheniformis]|nr:Ger(x)C family spore germination C-terminal domain-containing protein [Bacillus licheniformis]